MKKIISVLVLFNVSNTGNAQSILDSNKKWSYHFQLTAIDQGHPAFKAKYSGDNSLHNSAESNALSVNQLYILEDKNCRWQRNKKGILNFDLHFIKSYIK